MTTPAAGRSFARDVAQQFAERFAERQDFPRSAAAKSGPALCGLAPLRLT